MKLRARLVRWLGFCELDSMLQGLVEKDVLMMHLAVHLQREGLITDAENVRLAEHALKLADLPNAEWFRGEELDTETLTKAASGIVIIAEYLRRRAGR